MVKVKLRVAFGVLCTVIQNYKQLGTLLMLKTIFSLTYTSWCCCVPLRKGTWYRLAPNRIGSL